MAPYAGGGDPVCRWSDTYAGSGGDPYGGGAYGGGPLWRQARMVIRMPAVAIQYAGGGDPYAGGGGSICGGDGGGDPVAGGDPVMRRR